MSDRGEGRLLGVPLFPTGRALGSRKKDKGLRIIIFYILKITMDENPKKSKPPCHGVYPHFHRVFHKGEMSKSRGK